MCLGGNGSTTHGNQLTRLIGKSDRAFGIVSGNTIGKAINLTGHLHGSINNQDSGLNNHLLQHVRIGRLLKGLSDTVKTGAPGTTVLTEPPATLVVAPGISTTVIGHHIALVTISSTNDETLTGHEQIDTFFTPTFSKSRIGKNSTRENLFDNGVLIGTTHLIAAHLI